MRIFIVALLLLVTKIGFGQNSIDTVIVTQGQTTYLVFPKDVDIVDIPNKDFAKSVDGKTVFIKTVVANPSPTTFLVKCGDDYFQGALLYKANYKKTFYDFRNYEQTVITTTSVKTVVKEEKQAEIDTLRLIHKDRLGVLKTEQNKYKTIGEFKDNIYLGLANMKHDDNTTYIKLKVSNSSNVAYQIDYTAFEVVENKTISRNEIKEYLEEVPRLIASKDNGYLYFALPLIAIPDGSELKITLREKGGLRTVTIYVNAKTISSASNFNN